jgi:hypothetical protein
MAFTNPGGDSLEAWTFDQVASTGVHNGVLADVDRIIFRPRFSCGGL